MLFLLFIKKIVAALLAPHLGAEGPRKPFRYEALILPDKADYGKALAPLQAPAG
jgi:hypothetical protein